VPLSTFVFTLPLLPIYLVNSAQNAAQCHKRKDRAWDFIPGTLNVYFIIYDWLVRLVPAGNVAGLDRSSLQFIINHHDEWRGREHCGLMRCKPGAILMDGALTMNNTSELPRQTRSAPLAEVKAKQAAKIREIFSGLAAAGVVTLDEQAKILGLCRSTMWSLLRANHKASGLSSTVINRMWSAPHVPPQVRAKIREYVEAKAAGLYGHDQKQRARFVQRLTIDCVGTPQATNDEARSGG
jgi:hypothetical protein